MKNGINRALAAEKKIFTLFLALVANVGIMLASDIQIGGIWYDFDFSTLTATVTYQGGDSWEVDNEYTGSVTIPSTVDYNYHNYTVRAIGEEAFAYCPGLTSITIPNTVTSIGGYAFYGCEGLTSVDIPNFVTSIGDRAFDGCYGLQSVTLGNGVTSVGEWAFDGCGALQSPVYNEHIFACLNTSYEGTEYVIPDGIESIAKTAFWSFTSLKSITIPNSVTSIGDKAFAGCSGLTSVDIPNSVTNIGDSAFYDCSGLTSVTCVRETPASLGNDAFNECSNLNAIYVPCGTLDAYKSTWTQYQSYIQYTQPEYTIIGNVNREGAGTISVPQTACDNVITATPNSGYHFVQWSDGNTDNPRTIELTKDTAFTAEFEYDRTGTCGNDWALTWTYDPEGKVLTISGNGAFEENMQCGLEARSALTEVVFEDGVTAIGEEAFKNQTTLQTLVLGRDVQTINANAFYNCANLTAIYNHRPTPTNVYSNSFDGVDKFTCVLYVPKVSMDLYKNASVWGDFSHTQAIPYTYKVTFVDWDGTSLSERIVAEDGAATPPADPTRTGYTFTGWDKDFSTVTEDMIVTAQYQINQYQVEFRDWDGTLLKEENVEYNSYATAPSDPTRDWYTFIGWDKDFSVITSDLVVTAQYKEGQIREYTLLFSQSPDNSEIASGNVSFEVPTPPVITGYTFQKWIVVGGDLDDTIEIQAVYTADSPTSAPEVYTNPANPSQKLIRNGSVYILTEDKTYTVTGQLVK